MVDAASSILRPVLPAPGRIAAAARRDVRGTRIPCRIVLSTCRYLRPYRTPAGRRTGRLPGGFRPGEGDSRERRVGPRSAWKNRRSAQRTGEEGAGGSMAGEREEPRTRLSPTTVAGRRIPAPAVRSCTLRGRRLLLPGPARPPAALPCATAAAPFPDSNRSCRIFERIEIWKVFMQIWQSSCTFGDGDREDPDPGRISRRSSRSTGRECEPMPTFTCNHEGTGFASARPYVLQMRKMDCSTPLCFVCGRIMMRVADEQAPQTRIIVQ